MAAKRTLHVLLALALCACALVILAASSGCSTKAETPNTVVEHVGESSSSTSSSTSGSSTSSSTTGSSTSSSTSKASSTSTASGTGTVAFVTANGDVADNDFNAAIWTGVQAFANDYAGYTAKSYAPAETTDAGRTAALQKALDEGATVVILAGSDYSKMLPSIAAANPKVAFLLEDAFMTDANGASVTAKNVHCVTFREQEAGYLLGYALVKEGFRGLGFCGGAEVASVQRYGHGFVQGVQAACAEDGVADATYLAYWYTGTFTASPDIQAEVGRWYDNGVDVVFSCGGGIVDSVLASATEKNKPLAGCDVDQSAKSALVLTSAWKDLSGSTSNALVALAKSNGTWSSDYAGTTANLGLAESSVGLATANWRLANFSVDAYNAVAARIASGEIAVSGDTAVMPAVTYQLDIK